LLRTRIAAAALLVTLFAFTGFADDKVASTGDAVLRVAVSGMT
jgi:hypothetical protein